MHFKVACVCDVDLSLVVSMFLFNLCLTLKWSSFVAMSFLQYWRNSLTSAKRPNFFRSCRYPLFLWSRLGSEKCKATAAKDSEDDAPNQSLDLGTRPPDGTQLVTSFFESPKFSTTKKEHAFPGLHATPPPATAFVVNNRTKTLTPSSKQPRFEV